MKKSSKKNKPSKGKRKKATAQTAPQPDRRSFMTRFATLAGAAVVLGGVGFWGVRTVQASVAERDLTQLGQGTPTIVQVHDAQCTTCIALQREVRAAFEDFTPADLGYLVADIKTDDGLAFASRYGAGHSTLLFFDGGGNLTDRLVGPNTQATLTQAFATHVGGAN